MKDDVPPLDDPDLAEDQLRSMSIVRQLLPWREQIASGFGTGHGNAKLELFDVLLVMVAGFFNPIVRSQRLLDALSSQQWMQEQTGNGRVPRSTLSDALKRFDPEALRPIIEQLVKRIPALKRRDKDLEAVTRQVLAVDGSSFNLAGEVAWALQCRRGRFERRQPRVRLNMHLDVQRFTPVDCDISGQDDAGEANAMRRRIRPETVYVMDRNFLHFRLIRDILKAESNFVLRLRKNTCFEPTPAPGSAPGSGPENDGQAASASPLTDKDRAHGVVSDELGRLTGGKTGKASGGAKHYSADPPTQTLRRVRVRDELNQCELVLLTDLLDVPAYVVGALYKSRWQVELFFKWLKCYAHFDHLISKNAKGVTLQFYVAVIATLLLHLTTGRRVSKYALFWMGSVAAGHATVEQMQAGLARIERERELDKARRARKQAAAKNQP